MAEHEAPTAQGRDRLCDFIRENVARILESWEREVRLLPVLRDFSRPRLINHLPEFLERVAVVVETVHTGEEKTLGAFPEEHALERLNVGLDVEQVAQEYALLRACVLELYAGHLGAMGAWEPGVLMREVVYFNRTFDEAVATSVSRYARARTRTLVALERLSEAALGTEDLDTFLPRLLRVILETTEAVDTVTLLLREGDELRVRASVGLEALGVSGFRVRVGEGFSGTIAAERRPREVRSAMTDPLVKRQGPRGHGLRALYGVPLLQGDEVLGVAHMGSRTAFEFSSEDKLLFRAMVTRASALIVQARLVARERAAREEAEAHKQLLRMVIEQSGDAIIMADERGQVRIFNAEAERLHGVRREEVGTLAGPLVSGLLSVDGRPLSWEETPLSRALKGVPVTGAHWVVRRPDGSMRTLCGTALPIRRPDGSLAGAVLSARDETERLMREVETAEALALLDTLLATAPVGLSFVDRELRYVRVNHALAALNGSSVGSTLGRTVREVIPELAPTVEPFYRHVLDTGEPLLDLEVSGTTPGLAGGQGHWLVSYYPVWNRWGQVFMVGAVVVDITDRKRAEERMAQLEALVAAAPAGMALLDGELRYVHINEALARSNGLSVEAHRGRTVAEVLPEHAPLVEPLLRRVLETGEPLRGLEARGLAAEEPGVVHHWVSDYFPVRARDGRVTGVGAAVTDVTEARRKEDELLRAAEFRERFLGIVSHDLRNPLNAILLSANALMRSDCVVKQHLKAVRRITASTERMVRMIGELLDFTRGRLGGGIPITPRPANLRDLCRHVLEELEAVHLGRELRLRAKGDFQGAWDPDRLAQLLGNLGKNALDYSPADTPVDFSLHDEGGTLRVEVHNEGPPIPRELLTGIFEPFRRAVGGDAHPTSGLGLGLFIVQEIARAHGGTVEVRSSEGQGTTFTVRLPRHGPGAPAPERALH
ncbi:PAS domain S-box-containing protein [Archangium gephyra]|uniref:histidine kinase n=1 Tax=Archangium gephyra TaxID=48 RepID=A0AAC8QFY5_9BACT|nr:PAS domain-containing protein [Archangium gephyra]AKJ06719.1 sensory box histidine kinase [Archangium gephyra]REG31977.1 PAS domain S-box-containing protein [Archangium gephyra]